jgi:hypothetical protein
MSADRNWRFWLDDNGTVRKFIVDASNEARARELVQRAFPQATVFSHEEIPVMLQIPRKASTAPSASSSIEEPQPVKDPLE